VSTMSPTQSTSTRSIPWRDRFSPPLVALLLAILLFLVGGIINPNFLNINQAINIVRLAAFLGIIAAGQTLVIISGREGIDLSAAAVVTLSAILVYRVTNGDNAMIPVGLLVALAAGGIIGGINGIGIAVIKIPPLVMTLGMAGVVQGTILQVTQGELVGNTPPLMVQLISAPLVGGIAGVVFIWMVLGVAMWFLLERTRYGKQLFAIGVNRTTARLSGVRVQLLVVLTYALAGMLAAFAGFILLAFSQTVFLELGQPYLFPSIAAVVVGGTVLAGGKGSYWGTMSGALVLQLTDSLLRAMRLDEAYQLIVFGIVLLALILVYGRQRNLRQ
jgi:ribose transport system permease protein